MRIRHALLITAAAAAGLAGCSSPGKDGIKGPPPAVDTASIAGPEILAAAPAAPVPAGPADHFGDGVFEVLVDIKPGVYKTTGPPAGAVPPVRCYYARLKDTRGEITSLLASDYGNAGPDMVTIEPGDKAFESRGCGQWQLEQPR